MLVFLQPRGTAGTMPNIWDLNLRFTYDPTSWAGLNFQSRLILDVFHVGSQRAVTSVEQLHYNAIDASGNPVSPNPYYGMPLSYQPPMSVRLALEVSF